MTPLWGHSEIVAGFVASLVEGCERGFGPCQAMGVLDSDGNLVAGVVFYNWSPEHGVIEMSAASITRRWLTRAVLRAMYGYAFDVLGCQAAVARTDPALGNVRRMWKAIGAEEYAIPRLRGRETPEVLLVLAEETWKGSRYAETAGTTSAPAGRAAGADAGSEPGAAA